VQYADIVAIASLAGRSITVAALINPRANLRQDFVLPESGSCLQRHLAAQHSTKAVMSDQ